jgi:hypothetical protein
MKITKAGRTVTVESTLGKKTDVVELRLLSHRNRSIPRFSDPSPRDPNMNGFFFRRFHRNVMYPVVDVELDGGFEGVLELARVLKGRWSINPHYYPQDKTELASVNVLPAARLEHWENWFCYNDCNAEPARFYLRKTFEKPSTDFTTEFVLLSDFWEAEIELWDTNSESPALIDSGSVRYGHEVRHVDSPRDLSRPSLTTALDGCVEYLLKSRQCKPTSPMRRSTHLFYDYDARTYRQRNWLWTTGPGIRALLDAREIPDIAQKYGADELLGVARDIGDMTVEHQQTDREHPAHGMLMCRYDFEPESEKLYEAKYSPADGLFLAGWGWIPLFRATAEKKYLDACKLMVAETGELMKIDDMVQQDYFAVEGIWKDFTMDESGFGMEGLADTFIETQSDDDKKVAETYLGQLLRHLERPDGLWERNYWRHSKTIQPFSANTRGMGWAMEAVTSAWRMGLGDEYLKKSKLMADFMLRNQHEDGCWSFVCTEPKESQGVSEKGTPLWSVLLYRLYDMCHEEQYLNGARKALRWCVRNQYFGGDTDGWGGLVGCSPASGVTYRKYFNLSCFYAVGFFALALLEELKRDH